MPAEGIMGRTPADGAPPPPSSRPPTTIVFAGGDRPERAAVLDLPEATLVIAADSGVEHALALGFHVDLVVGDLDSADPLAIDEAIAAGADVDRHPTAKDATDLELALLAARDRGGGEVVVVGGHGGRLDHFFANALLLASPRFATLVVRARMGDAELTVVRDRADLAGHPGMLCSLLPTGGPAHGVRTDGLRYPLAHETLHPGSTRGVSNEFLATTATVTLDDGVLLAVVPHLRKDS
jgi:thiamine pyrophosphokinase